MRTFNVAQREAIAPSTRAGGVQVRMVPLLALALTLVGPPVDAAAQSSSGAASADTVVLTLAEARRRALSQNPTLLAERQEMAVARGELRQTRVLAPNPEVELQPDVEFESRSASDPRGSVGNYEAALTQEIEWAGQRRLRIRAGEQGLERTRATVSDAERTTRAEVTAAFYEAYAAQRQFELVRDLLDSNERLLEAVRAQLREGGVSGLEASLAEIEVGRARGRLLSALRDLRAAEIELKRIAALAPERPVRLSEHLPALPEPAALSRETLVQAALERRPDLSARLASVRQAEALRALAAREAIPNLRLSALGARSADGGQPWIGLGVGLTVPLWNRNRGEVAARAAAAEQAALEREATALAVRAEVEEAYGAYLAAAEEERIYQTAVLRPAQESQQRLETAFRAGKLNLSAVLLLRNQLLEAESGYWEAWLAKRSALARLESATAGFISTD